MRVCCISHSSDVSGGGQLSLLDLCDALTREGVQVHAVVPARGPMAASLEQRGVPYCVSHFVPWSHWQPRLPLWHRVGKKPLVHMIRSAALARAVRPWKCDLVLSNTLTFCEGALAARMLGLPHVTHVREFGSHLNSEYGSAFQMRALAALSRRVVFNSQTTAHHFRALVPAAKGRVVYNACEMPAQYRQARPQRAAGSEWTCVMVGSIGDYKGQAEAAEAVEVLLRRGKPARLRLIGAGDSPALEQVLARLAAQGLAGHVERTGHLTNPFEAMLEADVALVCCRIEAFGRVTVEAMKLGLPVIGAASGGTMELIRDGINGLLYRAGDPQDLADKIAHLAQRPELAARMGQQAQQWAWETFSLQRHGQEMLAVFEDCVNGS